MGEAALEEFRHSVPTLEVLLESTLVMNCLHKVDQNDKLISTYCNVQQLNLSQVWAQFYFFYFILFYKNDRNALFSKLD